MLFKYLGDVISSLTHGRELNPVEHVDALRTSLIAADRAAAALGPEGVQGPGNEKLVSLQSEVARHIRALKAILFSTATPGPPRGGDSTLVGSEQREDDPARTDTSAGDLVRLAADGDLLILLAKYLAAMDFETRKDAVLVFTNLIRRSANGKAAESGVVARDGEVLRILVSGYDSHDVALNCGTMLRACLKSEEATKLVLGNHDLFHRFFSLVQVLDFDVMSDAFASFKELLTRHPDLAAEFILEHYDTIIPPYNDLLQSKNYVSRRQSLKLLGEMLLERSNFHIMTRYISSPDNLKLIMNLLLDSRKNIQYEAFHIFKIFVANPKKSPPVHTILRKNKDRMIAYLSDFLTDRDDEQFQDDRQVILAEIENM
uniref:Uncharacterized protein n=1 Tax=Compsopogon caeruleus TaxID=31354 RepID=A0A7S1TID2_9RHOD|mmetsp:Transcript_8093/g.16284  ORF Transcript_8093/g.16284 Transcript_8093/m.16284 type:complete len:373 (+) Transcript_8093:225-1343(+)